MTIWKIFQCMVIINTYIENLFDRYDYMKDFSIYWESFQRLWLYERFSIYVIINTIYWKIFTRLYERFYNYHILKNLYNGHDYMKDFSMYGIYNYIYWKIFSKVMTIWNIFQCMVFIITYIEKSFQKLWLYERFFNIWDS